MTAGVATARDQSMVALARAWIRDRPLVALFVLLAVLVLVLQIVQPGIVTPNWVSTTLRFAIPLAIIAACQTLTMLTGGIDLSVAVVCSSGAIATGGVIGEQVLRALCLAIKVGVPDDLPEVTLTPRGDRRSESLVRVGPDERKPVEDDP